jgi:hypothetical protein
VIPMNDEICIAEGCGHFKREHRAPDPNGGIKQFNCSGDDKHCLCSDFTPSSPPAPTAPEPMAAAEAFVRSIITETFGQSTTDQQVRRTAASVLANIPSFMGRRDECAPPAPTPCKARCESGRIRQSDDTWADCYRCKGYGFEIPAPTPPTVKPGLIVATPHLCPHGARCYCAEYYDGAPCACQCGTPAPTPPTGFFEGIPWDVIEPTITRTPCEAVSLTGYDCTLALGHTGDHRAQFGSDEQGPIPDLAWSAAPSSETPEPPTIFKCSHEHGGARTVPCMYGCNTPPTFVPMDKDGWRIGGGMVNHEEERLRASLSPPRDPEPDGYDSLRLLVSHPFDGDGLAYFSPQHASRLDSLLRSHHAQSRSLSHLREAAQAVVNDPNIKGEIVSSRTKLEELRRAALSPKTP